MLLPILNIKIWKLSSQELCNFWMSSKIKIRKVKMRRKRKKTEECTHNLGR